MEIVFLTGLTMIISFVTETICELSIYKKIASEGYKIDMNKIYKYMKKDKSKFRSLCLFIPGVNIINSLLKMNRFEITVEYLFDNMNSNDFFIKMSEEEYQSYLDNPKSITAFNMSVDTSLKEEKKEVNVPVGIIKISNGKYRHDYNDGTFNDISFRKEEDKIVVTDISGKLASLSEEEQLIEINRIFKCLYKKSAVIEKKSETTLFKEALIEHRDEVLNNMDNPKKLDL